MSDDKTVTGPYTPEQIERIGGTLWERATKSRVYLNDWEPLVDLKVNLYKSGNVSSALLDGEPISNGKATRLRMAKVYLENGHISTDLRSVADTAGFDGGVLTRRLLAAIAQRVAELLRD